MTDGAEATTTDASEPPPPFAITFRPNMRRGFEHFTSIQIVDGETGAPVDHQVTGIDTGKLVVTFPDGVSAQTANTYVYTIDFVDGGREQQVEATGFLELFHTSGYGGSPAYYPRMRTYTIPGPGNSRPVQIHMFH
ncbi:MAG: hypothetical protein ACOCXJ_06555 [Planctomycetota bacterium]